MGRGDFTNNTDSLVMDTNGFFLRSAGPWVLFGGRGVEHRLRWRDGDWRRHFWRKKEVGKQICYLIFSKSSCMGRILILDRISLSSE